MSESIEMSGDVPGSLGGAMGIDGRDLPEVDRYAGPEEALDQRVYPHASDSEDPGVEELMQNVREKFSEINDDGPADEETRYRDLSTLEALNMEHHREARARLRVSGRLRTK